jgi:hypothetical protein
MNGDGTTPITPRSRRSRRTWPATSPRSRPPAAEDDGADDYADDAEELDEAEIFAEIKTARFLLALDLPLTDDLVGVEPTDRSA